jgi:hypothetical protein
MRRLVGLGLLAVLVAVLMIAASAAVAPAARSEIGIAGAGHTAVEFVGHVEQAGLSFDSYGYLTHIVGLADAALFSDPNPLNRDEKTARFTFRATAQASQRFAVLAGAVGGPPPTAPSLLDVDSTGSETFYFSPQGNTTRSFTEPASFSSGGVVATFDLRFQDSIAALVGIDPHRGVLSGTGELCQRSAREFTLDGQELRIGRTGLFARSTLHGWSVLTSPTPTSFSNFGGNTQVFASERCGDGDVRDL